MQRNDFLASEYLVTTASLKESTAGRKGLLSFSTHLLAARLVFQAVQAELY